MKTIIKNIAWLLVLCLTTTAASAQCTTWVDSPRQSEAENAHVSYRQIVKDLTYADDFVALSDEAFQTAFKNWQTAYEIAPAADGQRPFHYSDGRMFYRAMVKKTEDAAKQKEYKEAIIRLFDEELECYPDSEAYLLGRKGYDQFYLQGYSMDALNTLEMAMEKGGNETEYIVLPPLGSLLAYYFSKEKVDNVKVRALYDKGVAIADANAEGDLAQYYSDAKANLVAAIKEYENDIFDCAYFRETLRPMFEENMEDLEKLTYVKAKLKAQGCEENDAMVLEVQAQYDKVYAVKKEEYEAERIRNNPAYAAQQAYEAGEYARAVELYQAAIDKTEDDNNKATYYYQIAQIQNAKLGQLGAARQNANKAASMKSGWGQPYILIGDIYGKLSRNCGDAYQQRLAVLASIDKYQYARSIDSEAASSANSRIARLSGSMPIKGEAFQRGDNEGDTLTVKCGINEKVRLRFN